MEKKLIALALAGLASTSAFAQSNVTVYGVADMYIGRSSGNGGGVTTIGDGGNMATRVGFKGSEDLGNGLKAVFLLEYWAKNVAETNEGLTGARQQYVGLSGNFGTLTGGYQYNQGSDVIGANAPSSVTGVYSTNQLQTAMGNNGGNLRSASGASRWANSVKYQSPNWGGFTFSAAYAAGEDSVNGTSANSKIGLNGRYANGPFGIDVAYVLQNDKVGTAEKFDIDEWYVGGRYDFGVLKAFASYQTLRSEAKNTLANSYDHDAWTVGIKVPVGKHAVNVEYAKISYDPANAIANQSLTGSSKSYSIGYEHNLSKRTMLYTAVAHSKNDADVPQLISWNTDKGTVAAGESTNSFMMGMRHLF